jgi:hypothetical protein
LSSDKFENYEELRSYLEDLPLTWYPDLLRAMVEAAYNKDVFMPGGASKFVEHIERRNEKIHH